MNSGKKYLICTALTLFLSPAALSQDTSKEEPEHGMVELGVRQVWGDEYGRPDLPYRLNVLTSKFNEYRDIRNGFFIRRFRVDLQNLRGGRNYFDLQSQRAIFKDQSYLATFGSWGHYKLQFRYDEIPHIYSNTTRTLYTSTAPGFATISPLVRATLQANSNSPLLPSTIQTQVVPGLQFITPSILRRAGTAVIGWQPTAHFGLNFLYGREHQTGSRPIAQVFNSSPSASLAGGYGVELPEPINYFNNYLNVSTEYGNRNWAVQLGYSGSYLQNQIGELTYDNPFRTTDCVAPAGCVPATQGPATGRLDLWPNNQAHYLNFAGAIGLGKVARLMASISPGWLRQNDPFVPYTTNTLLLPLAGPLPAASLGGDKQTLAMNYRLATTFSKRVQFIASYRQYDYNNNTPIRSFATVQGDIAAPSVDENTPYGYNRKTLEATGNFFFGKKSSVKAGYIGEWMDRSFRDVGHSMENGLITALDWEPLKDLSFRISYNHSQRTPDSYFNDGFTTIAGGIPDLQPDSRRFDEAARIRNRGDATLEYSPTDRISFSVFGGTVQDNYNLRGHTNSAAPLNFLGTTLPYYLYGLLKDVSYNYGADADFTVTSAATLFAEYSHEKYSKRMASRYRTPASLTPLVDCSIPTAACDSPNNDWGSVARDWVDIWTIGWDVSLGKKTQFTTYYSLSAGKGHVDSFPLGDPTLLAGPDKFVLIGTNAAVPYPETTNRMHELSALIRYKLTSHLMPKIEYRYQQWDNLDYQTTPMTPYMGCVSPIPPGAAVPGCTAPLLGTPSPFYPYFVVGDTSAQRFLFLGVDQPSFHAHYVAATLEYHF